MVEIYVRQNNVDQALRALKKKLQNEGILREMKARKHFEKPSEKRVREKAEAVRRARKLARKRAQLEGLIPTKKKPRRRQTHRFLRNSNRLVFTQGGFLLGKYVT